MPLGSKPTYLKRRRPPRRSAHDPTPELNYLVEKVSLETRHPIGFNPRANVNPITIAR